MNKLRKYLLMALCFAHDNRIPDNVQDSMNGSWFDQNFGSISDDFFDQTLNLFDFPPEDVELNDGIDDWESQFQHLTTPSELITDFYTGACNENNKENLKLKKGSAFGDESVQPKRLQAAEASSGRSNPLVYDSSESKYQTVFRTTSPVSVLESSSSSSSAENSMIYQPKFDIPVKRPRSKCPRFRRSTFPFISSLHAPKCHPWGYSESESESESYLDEEYLAKKKQRKRRNLMLLSSDVEWKKPSSQGPGEIRKCTHCEVTKTPQWREGPMGPKTLCNACGVRYRSGRLFPEYRPAASPTFVPTLHSNSHRKVVEMRKNYMNVDEMAPMNTALPPIQKYF